MSFIFLLFLGFCGRPVKAELQISASAFTRSQFVAYGRFTLADSSDYDFDSIITQFETYEAIDIMKQTKTKEDNRYVVNIVSLQIINKSKNVAIIVSSIL